jgi:hypothetical protein
MNKENIGSRFFNEDTLNEIVSQIQKKSKNFEKDLWQFQLLNVLREIREALHEIKEAIKEK